VPSRLSAKADRPQRHFAACLLLRHHHLSVLSGIQQL
jgi:hypothetical protein